MTDIKTDIKTVILPPYTIKTFGKLESGGITQQKKLYVYMTDNKNLFSSLVEYLQGINFKRTPRIRKLEMLSDEAQYNILENTFYFATQKAQVISSQITQISQNNFTVIFLYIFSKGILNFQKE